MRINHIHILNTIIVLASAVVGGQFDVEFLKTLISNSILKTPPPPEYSEFITFGIKCFQSAVFAAIGYITKLAFDHFWKDKLFPPKDTASNPLEKKEA